MNESTWARMWELFHDALEASGGERSELLDSRCADDPELRVRIEALLRSHDSAPRFLDPLKAASAATDDPMIGSTIGSYNIEGLLGKGGMGVVYAARQTEPLEREVALKLIRRGMASGEAVARFDSERRVLARMAHQHIANVYDAGSTADGRPWVVMERVGGRPITETADTNRLTPRQRLELMRTVCLAVHHAHQRGVIHRDLKPNNIMVAEVDGDLLPKVIDFGIAKAVDPEGMESGRPTVQGRLIGTPEYMSPEQLLGHPVDTRSDVYALGVVMYELLTGSLPFDDTRLQRAGSAGFETSITTRDPKAPSTQVSDGDPSSGEIARARGTDVIGLRRELRGDLDWIVLKAMATDADRRYGSASELADDISRFLEHRPVTAAPPSSMYRLSRLVRRHRVATSAIIAVAISLVLGTTTTAWMAVRANQALDVSRREAATTRAVNQLLEDLLAAPDPGRTRDGSAAREVLVVDVLARASDELDSLDQQPAVEASLRKTLGNTYLGLGLPDPAVVQFERAVELAAATYPNDHPELLTARHNLALGFKEQGRFDEAETLLRPTLDARRKVLGIEHSETLTSMHNLAALTYERGRLDEARALLEELIPLKDRVLADDTDRRFASRNTLVLVLARQGAYAEAETLARDTLGRRRVVWGDDHPLTLSSLGNLAFVHQEMGALEEAEHSFRELLEARRRILGSEHSDTLLAAQNLATVQSQLGKFEAARLLLEEVLTAYRASLGESHPRVLMSTHNLARTITKAGDPDTAVGMYESMLPTAVVRFGADHHLVATFRGGFGVALLDIGRTTEAESELGASLRLLEASLGPDHRMTRIARERLEQLESSR